MRTIQASDITDAVRNLCIRANCVMNDKLLDALRQAREEESWPVARATLDCMLKNAAIAECDMVPICQDTGAACIFVELGQDVRIEGGSLVNAINTGVALGYTEGYLRKSMVDDPLRRVNTNDNTPALITVDVVDGDMLKITVAPKGAGSENMGQLKMLKPADGIEGVRAFVLDAVRHVRPSSWAWVWAATSTMSPHSPNARCCAPLAYITPTPSMPSSKTSCLRPSTS